MKKYLAKLAKIGPDKLLFAICGVILAFIWNIRSDVAELRADKRRDDAQDATIKWLIDREVVHHDRINQTRAEVKPPLYEFPYSDKQK